MKYLLPFLLTLAILTLQFCKSNKYTSPDDFQGDQIRFGSGGGFAGTYDYYYLMSDGALFKNTTTDQNFVKLNKADKAQVKQLFNTYNDMGLDKYQLDDPGNLTYFLEIRQNGQDHKITWGGGQNVDPNVKTLYQILMKLTR